MNVLLVSDNEISHSGAALEIDVGSAYDPKEIPGLAHFLEHMLFMGSKKYHNVSHFKDFINLNGGRTNAFTSDDYTKFYFTVNNDELEPALDIFSRFFIDPLFDPSRVEKEIIAVHNEYEMNLQKNIWRFFELLRRNAHSNHSFHRFTCGNVKTLKILPEIRNIKIQEEVVHFFHRYYSSHKMKLVIIGNHNLEMLEKIVIEKFSHVKNRRDNYEIPKHLQNMPPAYPPSFLGKFIWYKTIGNQKTISFVFPLNNSKNNDSQVNPIDFISSVISLEGEKGLKWSLLQKGWITELESNTIQKTPDFFQFIVTISLSETGILKTMDIIEDFFAWIKTIRKQGVSKKLYKQLRAVSYLNFLFSRKKSLEDDIINLVSNLNAVKNGEIPFENIVSSPELFMRYDAGFIHSFLDQLKVENALIILGAGDMEIDKFVTTEKFQQYFNVTSDFQSKFKEMPILDNEDFDYDSELFESSRVFNTIIRHEISKPFSLKPSKIGNISEKVKFRESVENEKSLMSFDELMEETFTYCDYMAWDSDKPIVNNNFADYEFSTALNSDKAFDSLLFKGNLIKCSPEYNDSLLYYKKLNRYDEIMKINYASEKINSSLSEKMNEASTIAFESFKFKLPRRLLPSNLEIKSKCSRSLSENSKTLNKPKISKNSSLFYRRQMMNQPKFMQILSEILEEFDGNEILYNSFSSQCFYDEILNDIRSEYPVRIVENLSRASVWLKTDRSFLIPKTDIKILIRVNQINQGKEKVILGVIVDIINSRNREELYDAKLLKYKANLVAHQRGIEVQIYGFSDKVKLLLEKLLDFSGLFEAMKNETFSFFLEEIKNFYENTKKAQSLQQLQKSLHKILRKNFLSTEEILSYLRQLSLEDLKGFVEKMTSNYEMKALFVGNILEEEATDLSEKIQRLIQGKNDKLLKFNTSRQNTLILKVPENYSSVYLMNNSNTDDENNALVNYYQIGERNDEGYVKSVILATFLNSQAFNFLRTEKQLGYVVHSNIFSIKNIDGFVIAVQGANNTPEVMNKFVEEFLFRLKEILINKSENEFKSIFQHSLQNFVFKDPDIGTLSDRLWADVGFGQNDFRKYERYVHQMKLLQKKDILDFFDQIFRTENRKISLQLFKSGAFPTNFMPLKSDESYGHREEKIIMEELEKGWDYYEILE